jgi:hypothetical protein
LKGICIPNPSSSRKLRWLKIVLIVEALKTSETSVNFYETIMRNIPEEAQNLLRLLPCS